MLTNPQVQVQRHLRRIEALVPDGADLKDYLAHMLDFQIASLSPMTSMGIVPLVGQAAIRALGSARATVELIKQPENISAKPEGIVDLSLIEWLLRPALLLKDGNLDPVVSGPWKNIPSNAVKELERSVCRLDLVIEGFEPIQIGTGFVVGRNTDDELVILTNAHVVEGALQNGWQSQTKIDFVCDFARHSLGTNEPGAILTGKYQIHPQCDLALLYLQVDRFSDGRLPHCAVVAGLCPEPTDGLVVGVLGHPSFDSNIDPFPKAFGFGNEFGVKRFSPGYIRSLDSRLWRQKRVDVLLHDATTLSGSSGSCIFDMQSKQIIGLHFGGWPKRKSLVTVGEKAILAELFHENGAVPLWTLKDDPLLAELAFA